MAAGFAQYLPHFGVEGLGPGDTTRRLKPLGPTAVRDKPELDVIGAAEERGRREAMAAARAEIEAMRAEAVATLEARIAEERERWTLETADHLAERLIDGLGVIEASLAAGVAGALAPFLNASLRDRAVEELLATLSPLLRSDRHIEMTIAGPEDLLAKLRARLEIYSKTIRYEADAGTDVRVGFDDTTIETRIAAWSERIGTALAEEPDV